MTRQLTWKKLKRKHIRRADREWIGLTYYKRVGGHWTAFHRGWSRPVLGRLKRPKLKESTRGNGLGEWPVSPPTGTSIDPPHYKKPPVSHVTDPLVRAIIDSGRHERRARVRLVQRSVLRIGHKPGRMNGYQRAAWGAGLFCMRYGYFPEWDPLHRSPTEDEVNGGADPYYPAAPPAFPPDQP